jgi:transposase
MTAKEVSMKKIRQILRLHCEAKLSQHQIAKSLSLSVGVVNKYIKKITLSGLTWPPSDLLSDDRALHQAIHLKDKESFDSKKMIDCVWIQNELRHKHVTLQLLWEEYCQGNDTPVSYSHFCLCFRQWKKQQPSSMRQSHKAGDKVFVDYVGQTIDIIDTDTGNIRSAQIFIGVLGASNHTFAEATWSQSLPDWISSHQRMFSFFGGVPALVVPDNLKSAVTKPCWYDPDINPTYMQMIEHYGTAVLPARPYKPKDKAKVEGGVLILSRWILARFRHQTFVGLDALNEAIKQALIFFNEKPFKKSDGCRLSHFQSIDLPALKPLPITPYQYRSYKKMRVDRDYHISLDQHYYSVPYAYCQKVIDVFYTSGLVECFYVGKSIVTHIRSQEKGGKTTLLEHMPKAHQRYSEWTVDGFRTWSRTIGPSTQQIIDYLLESKPHPEQGYRSCLGLVRLAKKYGLTRLEGACDYAHLTGARSRKSIESILVHSLDCHKPLEGSSSTIPADHENVRGSTYYH